MAAFSRKPLRALGHCPVCEYFFLNSQFRLAGTGGVAQLLVVSSFEQYGLFDDKTRKIGSDYSFDAVMGFCRCFYRLADLGWLSLAEFCGAGDSMRHLLGLQFGQLDCIFTFVEL